LDNKVFVITDSRCNNENEDTLQFVSKLLKDIKGHCSRNDRPEFEIICFLKTAIPWQDISCEKFVVAFLY